MEVLLKKLQTDGLFLFQCIVIAVITSLIYILWLKFINQILLKKNENEDFDATNYLFLKRSIALLILIIGIAFIIIQIPSFKHVATTVIASAGVIVAVIGFASQQVLANVISGIMIISTKPYRVNDRVEVKGISGKVEDISLRHTVIKNYQNKRVIVPNSIMNSEVIINANFIDDICCEWVEMSISYDASIDKAKELIKEEIVSHPLFIDHRNEKQKADGDEIAPIRVMSVGDFSITLRAWTWASDPGNAFILGCDLRQNIKTRFDQEGIEIPYPYSNVILRKH